jgi:hypothetical protein
MHIAIERCVVMLSKVSGIALNRAVREFLDPADFDHAAFEWDLVDGETGAVILPIGTSI